MILNYTMSITQCWFVVVMVVCGDGADLERSMVQLLAAELKWLYRTVVGSVGVLSH